MLLRFLFLIVLVAVPMLLVGQGNVTIFGNVQDGSGAVIPAAEITATNTLTGVVRNAVSTQSGDYVVSQLPIGVYTLRVQAQGFKVLIQENIAVKVDENRQINAVLELGSVSESVEVAAELVQVETRTGALREVVDSKRIVELPLNGRNPLQLQYLVAGVGGIAAQGQAQTLRFPSMAPAPMPTTISLMAAITTTLTSTHQRCFRRPMLWRNLACRQTPTAPTAAAMQVPSCPLSPRAVRMNSTALCLNSCATTS